MTVKRSGPEGSPEFPSAFGAADSGSLRGQQRTIQLTIARLALTVVATLCLSLAPLWPTELSENRHIELLGVGAAVLFLSALLVEVWLSWSHPERAWYDGRAVAESAKTLAWRYAVGGSPYPISDPSSRDCLAGDIAGLGTDIESLRAAVTDGGAPTEWMETARAQDLDDRRTMYLRLRVRNQEEWYARKAEYNKSRVRLWTYVLLSSETVAVVLALLKSLELVTVDLASVAAAIIASGAAWLGVKQHESIGAAYELASSEYGAVHVRLLGVDSEHEWAAQVASAEEAISREHTMWRASRTKLESGDSGAKA